MRRRSLSVLLGGVAVLASVPVLTAFLVDRSYGSTEAPRQACTAPAAWFPNTPRPVNFQVGSDNCKFHQWAWQEFLWATQPASGTAGVPNFLQFAYPSDLFVANPLPYPGRSTRVSRAAPSSRATRANRGEVLDMRPRDRKDDESLDVDAIAQAGTTNILIDAAGHPVYYVILIDSTWYTFARDSGYNRLSKRMAAPASLNFPTDGPGTVELKTAWRVAQMGDSVLIQNAASRFITTRASIAPVRVAGGKFVVDTANPVAATMALVGMHVVGTVPGHPEFIWATFEHVDNAPACAKTPAGTTNPATGQSWSFYTGNPACTNVFGTCNKGQGGRGASFTPTPICQVNPWGDTTSTPTTNAQNIQSINASVASQLTGPRALLKNYFLLGGQWTFPGGLPALFAKGSDTTNIHGSAKLANTTMESFTQNMTCFSCHNPTPGSGNFNAKNIAVSHVWPLPPSMRSNRVAPRAARPAELVRPRPRPRS